VLDYSALQAELGKAVGDDFRDGKITLPVVLAIQRSDANERAFWQRCLEDQDQRGGDLEQAIEILQRREALADAMARARDYATSARHALEGFADGTVKSALLAVGDFWVDRAD
jgi:octaprenyl-diphosphate synthase